MAATADAQFFKNHEPGVMQIRSVERIIRLVLDCNPALDKWAAVVDRIVTQSRWQAQKIKEHLLDKNYGEAVAETLRIWNSSSPHPADLVQVFREINLNLLAEQILEMEVTVEGMDWNGPLKSGRTCIADDSSSSIFLWQINMKTNFVGRKDEINKLHKMITSSHSSKSSLESIICISGLVGVGKSELALNYAVTYRNFYDDNVNWINATSPQTMAESFTKLCKYLNLPTDEGSSGDQLADSAFQKLSERKCLLIFDNAREWKALFQFLPKNSDPFKRMPYLLVTSQRTDLIPLPKNLLKLSVLRSDEAAKLIKNSLDCAETVSEQLAVKLGMLPLALQLAIKYLKEGRNLGQISHEVARFIENFDEDFQKVSSYAEPIFCAVSNTELDIRASEGGGLAVNIMRALALLRSEFVTTTLLCKIFGEDAWSSLRLLEIYSMITINGEKIGINPLLQHVVRSNMSMHDQTSMYERILRSLESIKYESVDETGKYRVLEEEYLCRFCSKLTEVGQYSEAIAIGQQYVRSIRATSEPHVIGIQICYFAEESYLGMGTQSDEQRIDRQLQLAGGKKSVSDHKLAVTIGSNLSRFKLNLNINLGKANTTIIVNAKGNIGNAEWNELAVVRPYEDRCPQVWPLRDCTLEVEKAVLQSLQRWRDNGKSFADWLSILRKNEFDEIADVMQDHMYTQSPIWFEVGEPVYNFTGREVELETLNVMLSNSHNADSGIGRIVCINGLGGIGKSSLARKYAFGYLDIYESNVIWIHSETMASMEASFRRLALNFEIFEDTSTKSIVAKIYEALRHRKCLLIFDNVAEMSDLKGFLPPIQNPGDTLPHVLITSRRTDVIPCPENQLTLDVLSLRDAMTLVQRQLPELNSSNAEKLVDRLQRLPLALQQALAYISDTYGIDDDCVAKYFDDFTDSEKRLLDDQRFMEFDDYSLTTLTTWRVTLHRIGEVPSGHNAIQLIHTLSYLNPDCINIDFITSMFGKSGSTSLALLRKHSMIWIRGRRVVIHRLVQQVLRAQIDVVEEFRIVDDISSFIAAVLGENKFTTFATACVAHGVHLFAFQYKHKQSLKRKSVYVSNLCYYLVKQKAYADALEIAKKASRMYEELYGEDDGGAILLNWRIADTQSRMGNYSEAKSIMDGILSLARKHGRGDVHSPLPLVLASLLKIQSGVGYHELSQDILDQLTSPGLLNCGEGHPDSLHSVRTNAALVQNPYKLGKLGEALKLAAGDTDLQDRWDTGVAGTELGQAAHREFRRLVQDLENCAVPVCIEIDYLDCLLD